MRHKKLSEDEKQFMKQIRAIEEQNFADQLDPTDLSRMKSDEYSWLYRPSHHIATGLLTQEDILLLSKPNTRLLSIGAYPAYLERVLVTCGIPAAHIVIADSNPAIADASYLMQTAVCDCTKEWPDMGSFDRIIFPESLCIAIADTLKQTDNPERIAFPNDAAEAALLETILGQALHRLRPDGKIRANGPMSHPNVIRAASESLETHGRTHCIDYERYFLTVRHAEKTILTFS